jgi:hypothetical protein
VITLHKTIAVAMVLAVLLACMAGAVFAAPAKPAPKGLVMGTPAEPAGGMVSARGVVSAVDAKKNSLTLNLQQEKRVGAKTLATTGKRAVMVKPGTPISFAGKAIKLASLKPGTVVIVFGEKKGNQLVASRVTVIGTPESAKAPAKAPAKPAAKLPPKPAK